MKFPRRSVLRASNYGKDFAQADVTDQVRAHVRRGVLNVLVTTEELQVKDPYERSTKALTIDYTLNGRDRRIEIIEGSRVILP